MSFGKQQVDDIECRNLLKKIWQVKFDVAECFPKEIKEWIDLNSTLLGVAPSYVAWPLLVVTAYCAQHSIAVANSYHCEPILLYGLVVGRSGKFRKFLLYPCKGKNWEHSFTRYNAQKNNSVLHIVVTIVHYCCYYCLLLLSLLVGTVLL